MEKLVINVPDQKSTLVKQILQELGVTIQETPDYSRNNYREKLTKVSIWSKQDVNAIEEAGEAFNHLKTEEW